ncbi:MAG: type II and III secretion system protein [Planctomycetota bacterium]|nr:MAG: type II and III secretion system protein [Planctomycetota bacterium]
MRRAVGFVGSRRAVGVLSQQLGGTASMRLHSHRRDGDATLGVWLALAVLLTLAAAWAAPLRAAPTDAASTDTTSTDADRGDRASTDAAASDAATSRPEATLRFRTRPAAQAITPKVHQHAPRIVKLPQQDRDRDVINRGEADDDTLVSPRPTAKLRRLPPPPQNSDVPPPSRTVSTTSQIPSGQLPETEAAYYAAAPEAAERDAVRPVSAELSLREASSARLPLEERPQPTRRRRNRPVYVDASGRPVTDQHESLEQRQSLEQHGLLNQSPAETADRSSRRARAIAYQPDDDLFDDESFDDPPREEDDRAGPDGPPLVPPPVEREEPVGPFRDVPIEIQQRPHQRAGGQPFTVLGSRGELVVTRRRNKILRSENDLYRVAVVDPNICDVIQFTPREVSIIGKSQGATSVTFWFADGNEEPVTYLVRVIPDPEVQIERERQYQILEEIIAELFPDSKVQLLPVADKLIVRGQAKGAEEAAQILAVIRGQAVYGNGFGAGGRGAGGNVVDGQAADPLSEEETGGGLPAANVINMLRIPGVQQVALKVKIAELNRTAARQFGIDLDLNFDVGSGGSLMVQTLLNMAAGSTTSISGTFDNDDINFGIHFLQSHDVIRILSEPTLVTLSGRPASFLAGGEFAVPTVVGVEGASGIATDFRSFGVILNFLPTVIDKDRIRLEISPEFSEIDQDLAVDGTPGLNTRAVTTTVEMREGQAFAIAGLLEDSMNADTVSDVPWLAKLLGKRSVSRNETELLILVTPELVHPLEAEEVPPLPGFDVTEPTNCEFYWHGEIEGRPTREYRSTIWPRLRNRYRNGGPAMISGPFGHGQ